MISKSNWEQKMKAAADGHSQLPPEYVWQNVEKELHPKEKRRMFFWLGLVAVLGSSMAFLYQNASSHSQDVATSTSKVINEVLNANTTPMTALSSEDSLIKNNSEAKIDLSKPENSIASDLYAKKVTSAQPSHPGMTEKSIHTKQTKISKNSPSFVNESNENRYSIEDDVNSQKAGPLEERYKIEINDLTTTLFLTSLDRKVKMQNKIKCPSFNRKGSATLFAEFSVSGGIHNRDMMSADAEYTKLLQFRKDSESTWYNWSAEFLGGVYLNPNIYVGAGLSYSQVKDRFNYSVTGITKVIINFDPVTGNAIDTSTVIGTLVTEGEIRFSSFDFPIKIGYENNYGGWGIGAEAGLLLNLSTISQGRIFDKNFKITPIENQGDIYKKNLGLGASISLLIKKDITPDLAIYFKPGVKTYLKDWNTDPYPIKSEYKIFYASIGVRKQI